MEIKKTTVVMALALVIAAVVPVSALYIWQTEPQQIQGGIVLQVHPEVVMQLGIYWDSACTQNVTTIDFGEMVSPGKGGQSYDKIMWIRNEGNVSHKVYWNSTLQEINITDSWTSGGYALNGTKINTGQNKKTQYRITIQPYTKEGTYNWTLTVWAEYEY